MTDDVSYMYFLMRFIYKHYKLISCFFLFIYGSFSFFSVVLRHLRGDRKILSDDRGLKIVLNVL